MFQGNKYYRQILLLAYAALIYNFEALDANDLNDDLVMLVDSDLADYNGKKITLSGNVLVEHELGSIAANWVELTPETIQKKINFNMLDMKNEVKISLRDGGQLSCASANVDYKTLQGHFQGNPQQEYVVYTENCSDKAGTLIPLVVKSRQMLIKIDRSEINTTKSPHSCISSITADENVTVNYNNDFIAAADHATYQRQAADPDTIAKQSTMTGLISLRAKEENGLCQVRNHNGDLIKASNICIDTINHHLLFGYPRGAIYVSREKGSKERIDFAADTMTWDDQQNLLVLRDHVVISEMGIGQLTTDKEIRITQQTVDGLKHLNAIESLGPTTLTFSDEEKELAHTLICHGTLFIDHKRLQTTMDSPLDENGNVITGMQVYYQDNMGEIYADKLYITYAVINHSLVATKLLLEGNVHIMNRCTIDPERQSPYLQYALADTVEYTPQAKEISLAAKGKRHVLFFDKVNNLQVSAPGLKIRRDQTTKKESIQGIGNVRFNFVEKEFDEMDKYFHLKSAMNDE